ncbi:serine/threonine-protein phosphatase PGAM5, mitochondrial isoform X1 [Schistocerca nitens]|uniref:serine/threonine-protein phosphatase PGAM5, mitochondrial isoform X1 n=1 Tax=Schistocerca nitens TaxID=7011 RepID=UPI0021177ED7|nr:serine/threonine-protein phosphatase PGAM5, mitochondrial isoform X1 [Schistocerca nitens]
MVSVARLKNYVIAGLSACGGAAIVYYGLIFDRNRKQALQAAYTDNFTPSVKWDKNWDRMEPTSLVKSSKGNSDDNRYNEELEKKKSTATRNLILIRHGQYNLSGETDAERVLTELGRKQAALTGQRLKELDMPYTCLIRSTMARAVETAKIIHSYLPDVPVQDCNMLEEGAPIPPEPPVGHWKPEVFQFHRDGARIEGAFRKYFHRAKSSQTSDSYEILVCHANVIRYFVCRALQFPPEAWLRLSLNHASITWIVIRPSGFVYLRSLGDTGHMPAADITST